MGATCTTANKVTIPPRVIIVQPKQTPHITPGYPGSFREEMYPFPPIKKASFNSQENRFNNDGEIETNYTSLLPTLRYDLHELGIGEHYLEKESIGDKAKSFIRSMSKKEKLKAKWERVIVKMRQKIDFTPHDDSLYNYIDYCIREYAVLRPQKYSKILKHGPSMRYRWSVWKNYLDLDSFYIRNLYEKFRGLSSPWETDIRKDLNRSFPEEPYFASSKYEHIGQEQLFNVLKAVSLYFPNIGYTQSMNFLVGFLLLINGGNELEAFWAFVSLARKHKYLMMGLFEKNLPLLDVYIHIFYELLQLEMPAVYAHIKQQQLPDQLWLLKWFMTGFVYSLPPKQVVRIWDFLLEDGILGMVKVALGIIKFIEKDLLSVDIFGMDQLFRQLNSPKKTCNSEEKRIDGLGTTHNPTAHQIDQSEPKEPVRDHAPGMVSIHNETSEIHFSFQELDIAKVIGFAKKVDLNHSKTSMILQCYFEKIEKPMPEPYNKFFRDWEGHMSNSNKLEEFQHDIDYHILKSELSEPLSDEVVVSNLLDGEDNNLVLKGLEFQ